MTPLTADAFATSGGARAPGHSSARLGPGARGSAVAQLQATLGIRATGRYDAGTRRAVRLYQRSHGLTPDGLAGASTLAALGLDLKAETAGRGHVRRGRAATELAELAKIARCESGGNPKAVSAGGGFRGKYQFDLQTWRSIGGTGDPAQAPEAEQDRLALALLRARGTAPWPNCA